MQIVECNPCGEGNPGNLMNALRFCAAPSCAARLSAYALIARP